MREREHVVSKSGIKKYSPFVDKNLSKSYFKMKIILSHLCLSDAICLIQKQERKINLSKTNHNWVIAYHKNTKWTI